MTMIIALPWKSRKIVPTIKVPVRRGNPQYKMSHFSLTETANVNGSRKYLHMQMSNDEINLMRGTIDQLKEELHEERSRVDALKACLEQEREKYEQLSASIGKNHALKK